MDVPEKPSLDGLEAKWDERWEAAGIYRFDRSKTRDQIFAIDTPPPTASGSLHVGHVMSFTHTDLVARYKRMQGFEVFYPMGWDDNGLPTERRVQNYFGVRCDPSLPYAPDFDVEAIDRPKDDKRPVVISRTNFIELCERLTAEDEKAYESLFRRLALSVDWTQTYTTIGETARRASQRAFLRLLDRGLAYQAEAPTMWDVDFQTAVAQAEIEDREQEGQYHRIAFDRPDGGRVEIETSRPELLPACVALVVHPDDSRYASLVGGTVLTPLFRVSVPVVAHPLADPEKGTGVAMICTFGDLTDVTWWRELQLPARVVIRKDGTLGPGRFGEPGWESEQSEAANVAMAELTGKGAKQARRRIVEILAESGDLLGEPQSIRHPVKFYENGNRPLEIITSRQWFVKTLPFKEELLARGRQIRWHPEFMGARYQSWVEGLNQDWAISRQRYFGVPFPVWYRLDDQGEPDLDHPLVPQESSLPVDPQSATPPGVADPALRDAPGGFTGDPDVMDTWATSSLTPQIVSGWEEDPDLFARLFPMDLRPQAHEIIRTWLFYTVLKAHLEFDSLPFTDAAISGFVLDPDRKKMSKSKGNAVTPIEMFEHHSADAVRYWAASARLGVDATFDEQQMKVGRRLAIKILNASRFALTMQGEPGDITEPIDRSMLASLRRVVTEATTAFENYEHAKALDAIERAFWSFCDDYLELVKQRAYGTHGLAEGASAIASLRLALHVFLRLFAPFLPYVTEEVWSWWQEGSVHHATWPTPDELPADGDPGVYAVVADVLTAVRKEKALRKVSLRTPAEKVTVHDNDDRLRMLSLAAGDLREAGNIHTLEEALSSTFTVDTALAPPDPAPGPAVDPAAKA